MSEYKPDELFEVLKDGKEHDEYELIKKVYGGDTSLQERLRIDFSELKKSGSDIQRVKKGNVYFYTMIIDKEAPKMPPAFKEKKKEKKGLF